MNLSHLAAPHRNSLSATAKVMIRGGLLLPEDSHLDYGCGRGGDVERLRSLGYNSTGYDPYYFPKIPDVADVVTVGYVLNVVESTEERQEALLNAWSLCKKYLIVSTNVSGSGTTKGSYTPIGTFTKPYNYIEFRAFIESIIGYEATKITSDKLLVKRDGRQFKPLHYQEILREIEAIASQGWIPPTDAVIKSYSTNNPKYLNTLNCERINYYRFYSKSGMLPGKSGLVKCLHIPGGKSGEGMKSAITAIQRRNKILEMKFHCKEQSFLSEFLGMKKLSFLESISAD